jgi:hypothetical protein
MAKNKAKNRAKRKQKRAADEAVRRRLNRKARYMMNVNRLQDKLGSASIQQKYGLLEWDSDIRVPQCDGGGECCKGQHRPVDPGDVWRIMQNEKVKEKWGVEKTKDLYGDGKPLIYDVNTNTNFPTCATMIVENEAGEKVCPFLEDDGCMLGDDRLSFCKSQPLHRVPCRDGNGHIVDWGYTVDSAQCEKCSKRGEIPMTSTVSGFMALKKKDYEFTDLWTGFLFWLRKLCPDIFFLKLGSMLVFDWDTFGEHQEADTPEEERFPGPTSEEKVLLNARFALESIWRGRVEDVGQGPTDGHLPGSEAGDAEPAGAEHGVTEGSPEAKDE